MISYTVYHESFRKKDNTPKTSQKQKGFSQHSKEKLKKILELWNYANKDRKDIISFITLTLSSKEKEHINYSNLLKQFIEKINYQYGNRNYVWKKEYQKNGNTHFHILYQGAIDWKIVRSQWNKLQKEHVDDYQKKHKEKYRNGYYFDTEMKDKNGNTVEEEVQLKRYRKGYKANWRNPNSTDVKIDENQENIANYISKYISKLSENSETSNTENNKLERYWGCSDKLKKLSYARLYESDTPINFWVLMNENIKKEIIKEERIVCRIHEKINCDEILEAEKKQIQINSTALEPTKMINQKLIEKNLKKYATLFD